MSFAGGGGLAASEMGLPAPAPRTGTAVRILSISAAQNKRGKDCFEGGMGTGSFTWFKDMGGQSNWLYATVSNVTEDEVVEVAMWLLYEASTEPLVDPLSPLTIQVGFFNQSKNANRQVPLFELAEESRSALELPPGQTATLKFRINDLSSHHQNQRFIVVVGPSEAPIRGSRSVPIEIMSKPRAPDNHDTASATSGKHIDNQDVKSLDGTPIVVLPGGAEVLRHVVAPGGKRLFTEVVEHRDGQMTPDAVHGGEALLRRPRNGVDLSTLVAVTDPAPSPKRTVDIVLLLLDGLDPDQQAALHDRLGEKLGRRSPHQTMSSGRRSHHQTNDDPATSPAASSKDDDDDNTNDNNNNDNNNGSSSSNGGAGAVSCSDDAAAVSSPPRGKKHPRGDAADDGDPKRRFRPLVKAILAMKGSQNNNTNTNNTTTAEFTVNDVLDKLPVGRDPLALSDEDLSALFADKNAPSSASLSQAPGA